MANMALNIEQRLGQKLTNEQLLLWNYVISMWPNMTFTPLHFSGSVAGTEFLTYSANKLYLIYSFTLYGNATPNAAPYQMQFSDYLNVNKGSLMNIMAYWDATAAAARYLGNTVNINNILFSRLNSSPAGQNIEIIGFRLTI